LSYDPPLARINAAFRGAEACADSGARRGNRTQRARSLDAHVLRALRTLVMRRLSHGLPEEM